MGILLVAYVAMSRCVMRHTSGGVRDALMAALNVIAVHSTFFSDPVSPFRISTSFVAYLLIVLAPYGLLRFTCKQSPRWYWVAFAIPIAALVIMRYLPDATLQYIARAIGRPLPRIPVLVGLSYMAFRCSRLVLEVRNGAAPMPGLFRYLAFAFFLPTLSVGPINTYANFSRGFAEPAYDVPFGSAGLRILVGLVKFQFFCALLGQLDYAGFLRNGHLHPWIHLPIAMVAYYLYLYCNFSGFCDMAIATSALVGIPVSENFDRPFVARNIKDFWNRWHITLSQYMRDVVFSPLSKSLVRTMGPSNANHAVAIAVTVVFLLVGVWHGAGINYALYGLAHAVGLVANHYYTIGLKHWLGRDGFKKYTESRLIHAISVAVTFTYCAASLMFFANTPDQLRAIVRTFR